MPADHVIDVTAANFESTVIAESARRPILLDFWAPWCGPCRTLLPQLEALAAEYAGRFLLVKVNIDDHPELAQRFAVRSVPTVKLLRNGSVVDEFLGAQPTETVRRFLDRHVEPLTASLREAAVEAHVAGDVDGALALLEEACAREPGHTAAWLDRLRMMLEAGRHAEAQELLAGVPAEVRRTEACAGLAARLALAGPDDDLVQLQARVAAAPEDCAARLALGRALAGAARYDEALEQLLASVRLDRTHDDGAARKLVLEVFKVLGNGDARVRTYRRALASALN